MFSSTCAVYGEPTEVPMPETLPTDPVNAYGASKLAVDRMISDECRAHGLGAVSLRYFNVAGASGALGEDHEPETHLIPLVLQAAAGTRDHVSVFGTDYRPPDGTAVRDYIHIEDLGAAHILGSSAPPARRAPDLQPRQRHRLLGRQVIEAARRHRPRDPGQGGGPPTRAIRPRWWPPRSGSATSSAGSRASPRSRR